MAEISAGQRVSGEVLLPEKSGDIFYFSCWTMGAAVGIKSSQKYRPHGDGVFGNNLEVMYIASVPGKYPNHMCPLEEDPRRYTQAKVVLTHTLKAGFVADALCKLSYLFQQPWSRISLSPTNHYGEA